MDIVLILYFSRTTQLQPPNDCGWQYLYRLFITLNGRIPGPDLVVTEGQIVVVKVTNKLTSEGITIHWHGIHQRKSPRMDGVAFILQPPIVPGAEFTYIFA